MVYISMMVLTALVVSWLPVSDAGRTKDITSQLASPSEISTSPRHSFTCHTNHGALLRETTVRCSVIFIAWRYVKARHAVAAVWRSGNGIGRINEVITVRRVRLLLGWVTVFGQANHLGISPSHPGQLSLLPQRDGKWVSAKVRWWSAAGE